MRGKGRNPAVVAAWCPETWANPRVTVNGVALADPRYISYGGERFVIVPVDKGEGRIDVQSGSGHFTF